MDTNNALMLDKELNYEEDGDILYCSAPRTEQKPAVRMKPRVLVVGQIKPPQAWTVVNPFDMGRMDALAHQLCIPESYYMDTESRVEYAKGHYSVKPSLLSASMCRPVAWLQGYYAYLEQKPAFDSDCKDFLEGWLVAQEQFCQVYGIECERRIETVQDVDYE